MLCYFKKCSKMGENYEAKVYAKWFFYDGIVVLFFNSVFNSDYHHHWFLFYILKEIKMNEYQFLK